MKIKLSTTQPKECFLEFASQLETEIDSDYNQFSINIPSKMGVGSFKGVSCNDNLNLFQYYGNFVKNLEIEFDKKENSQLLIFYNLLDEIELLINDTVLRIEIYQNVVLSIPAGYSYKIKFSNNSSYALNVLDITNLKLKSKAENSENEWEKILNELFSQIDSGEIYYHKGSYNLKSVELFKQIENFKKEGILKYLFLEAKAHEILVQQLLRYEEEILDPNDMLNGSARNAEFIAQAAQILREELKEIKTVKDLARSCATNNNKLQEGFKRYFGQTVNQYLNSVRIEKGSDLLIETDYNISEIVDAIGLSSKSYFSKIFRQRYGISPSEFRKRLKKASVEIARHQQSL